jgi:hypothetical protein
MAIKFELLVLLAKMLLPNKSYHGDKVIEHNSQIRVNIYFGRYLWMAKQGS